jgi:hypothetical protein
MANLPIMLPEQQLTADIERSLDELAEHRMLSPARRAGYELLSVGVTGLPEHEVKVQTQWGTWLFVNHLEDPTAKEYKNEIPVPDDQKDRLFELSRHGVKPDLAWIAHQLPDSYKDGDPLVPPPRELREKDERLKLRLIRTMRIYLKGVFTILAGVAAAPLTVVGGVVAGVGLDPIILGGVKHPELPIVKWCVLAQWEWE